MILTVEQGVPSGRNDERLTERFLQQSRDAHNHVGARRFTYRSGGAGGAETAWESAVIPVRTAVDARAIVHGVNFAAGVMCHFEFSASFLRYTGAASLVGSVSSIVSRPTAGQAATFALTPSGKIGLTVNDNASAVLDWSLWIETRASTEVR